MPSVVLADTWDLEALFSVGGDLWKNSIEVKDTTTGVIAPVNPSDLIVAAWHDFLVKIHFPDTTLVSITARPVVQVVGPPSVGTHFPLWETTYNDAGTGNVTWGGAHFGGSLPKDVVIYAKRSTSGGRNGKSFFRNIITEADVQSSLSGTWTFTDHPGGWQTSVFNTQVTTFLAPYFAGGGGAGTLKFAVAHLLKLPAGDARSPFSTVETGMTAVRPAWNRAHR
jgi:hypothetical protein